MQPLREAIMPVWAGILFGSLLFCSQIKTATAIVLGENDYSCISYRGQPPVVLIHGLFETASYLDPIAAYLQLAGFCTYAITYGAPPEFPLLGAVMPIAQSADVVADFISTVQTSTGADKVHLVGHSEGALLTLYLPKFYPSIAAIVDTTVGIAPPTHGTTLDDIISLATEIVPLLLSDVNNLLSTIGCPACAEFEAGSSIITPLTTGPIAQPGISYHIIASNTDEIVTPASTSFVDEPGVVNMYIQDRCHFDVVGHASEPSDLNIIQQVAHFLDPDLGLPWFCALEIAPLVRRFEKPRNPHWRD